MKKIIVVFFVAVVAAFAGYGIHLFQPSTKLSDLVLANVEALALDETLPPVTITCGQNGGTCWTISGDCYVSWFIRYDDCAFCGYTAYSCVSPCS